MRSLKLSRRAFLGTLLGGTVAVSASGCSDVIDYLTRPDLPASLQPPGGSERHPIAHLLNRAAFGPRPGQIAEVEKMGREKWIDRQLDYKKLGDGTVDWRVRRYDTLKLHSSDLLGFARRTDREFVAGELARATLVRAIHSERQLYEVMVLFWSEHFSIYQYKNPDVMLLKTVDERDVIRPYALGKFSNMLKASAHSPAMLYYLDNNLNEKTHPNENYAREIMELHTLGVDGGYTEQDVVEVARCFTGWTVNNRGHFAYNDEWHDKGEKLVLGEVIPADGDKSDGNRVLDILVNHPSTARFVCTKLVRRFVADDPPPNIIEACFETWQTSNGDIRRVLKTLLMHEDFDNAPPKFKRPFEFVVFLLRSLNADYSGDYELVERLETMGQRPFTWVTPDGFPDEMAAWSNGLLKYWNFAQDVVNFKEDGYTSRVDGTEIDIWHIAEHVDVEDDSVAMLKFFGRLILKRDLNDAEAQALNDFLYSESSKLNLKDNDHRRQMINTLGLLTSVPAFVYR